MTVWLQMCLTLFLQTGDAIALGDAPRENRFLKGSGIDFKCWLEKQRWNVFLRVSVIYVGGLFSEDPAG